MNVPSVKTIETHLTWLNKVGDPKTLAKQVRKELNWLAVNAAGLNGVRDKHLQAVFGKLNHLLQTHGVEYIAHRLDDQHGAHGITYLNTGETYSNTICYDHHRGTLAMISYGDKVEAHINDYP